MDYGHDAARDHARGVAPDAAVHDRHVVDGPLARAVVSEDEVLPRLERLVTDGKAPPRHLAHYAVDLVRSAYYGDSEAASFAVLADPAFTVTLIALATVAMLSVGTLLFVRSERNR